MKILFVLNPTSGKKQNKEVDGLIKALAAEHHFTWELMKTKGSGDSERVEDRIKRFQPEKVVAIGGDGTINLVASCLLNKNITLGILPSGSADGLAHNLNIPVNKEEALLNILKGKSKSIDVLEINEYFHCLHLADVGINARVVKRFEEEGSKGISGYGKQLAKEIFSKRKAFRFKLSSPELEKNMKAEMLVIANARSFGTGAQINPKGKIDDGRFEIVVIKPYPWWYLFTFAISFYTGRLDRIKHVFVYSTDQAWVKFRNAMDLQIDGELMKNISELKIKVLKGALKVYPGNLSQ